VSKLGKYAVVSIKLFSLLPVAASSAGNFACVCKLTAAVGRGQRWGGDVHQTGEMDPSNYAVCRGDVPVKKQ